MHVQVHEARHHEEAGAVDLVVRALRVAIRPQRQTWRAGGADRHNPVPLHDDVHRPMRRTSGAVDDGGAADHEGLERAYAVVVGAVRSGRERITGRRFLGREPPRERDSRQRDEKDETKPAHGTLQIIFDS
jgi:hypothetical protein